MWLNPFAILAFFLLSIFAVVLLQVGILTLAFDKLGLSPGSAFLLLFVSLMGSAINLPLFKVRASEPQEPIVPPPVLRMLKIRLPPFDGYTVIALNVGGGLIPIAFSLYLLLHNPGLWGKALVATSLVAAISYASSRPVPGIGIGMPILVAPLTAAIIALTIGAEQSAPLAYISGTLGVLIGADILRLNNIRQMGSPIASIGGAGTFDGIFITGIVAVLLA